MKGAATFSECGRYRYTLHRDWSGISRGPMVVFCGLNPSTADATRDDPTVRREVAFAKAWGYARYCKVNIYALRSTDPKGLWRVADPCGPDNLAAISEWAIAAQMFVAAWGNHVRERDAFDMRVRLHELGVRVHALKLTKAGNPQHPLYLPKTLAPFEWPLQGTAQ